MSLANEATLALASLVQNTFRLMYVRCMYERTVQCSLHAIDKRWLASQITPLSDVANERNAADYFKNSSWPAVMKSCLLCRYVVFLSSSSVPHLPANTHYPNHVRG